MKARRPNEARHGARLAALLLVVVAIAYHDALRAWFAADDFHWLEVSEPRDVLASFFRAWGHGPAYRPIARVSFLIDRLAFGLDARGWHAHGLLLLAIDGTLLGVLLARLTADRVLAASAAAIFVLLPSGYENTIWISGRIHPLGLAFALGALLLLDGHLAAPSRARLAAMAASDALALLSYEATLYLVPFGALVALLRVREGRRRRDAAVALAVLAAVAAAYLCVRWLAVGGATLYPMWRASEILTPPFAAQLAAAARTLGGPLYGLRWLLAACAVATALAAPRLLAVVGLGAAAAVVAYAPFALAVGNAPRFVFGSGLGVAIAVAALVAGVARIPRVGLAAAALAGLLVVGHLVRQDEAIAHEWKVAGDVGRRVLEGIDDASPHDADVGATYVLGPPAMVGRAMLFFTYFDAAVRVFAPDVPQPVIAIGRQDRDCIAARLARRDARASTAGGGRDHGARPSRARLRRELPECRTRTARRRLPAPGDVVLAVDPRTFEVRRVARERLLEWLRSTDATASVGGWHPPPGSG